MSKELTVSEAVKRRIASKAYLAEPAPSVEDMELITEAGLWAPTAHNIQNSLVLAIQNKDFKNEVAQYFHEGNRLQVESSQVTFLFVGTPWSTNDEENEALLYNNSISHWGLPDELAHSMSKGSVDYYNNVSDFKNQLDIYSSTTQMGMMMLQASALGYDTNGMLGFEQKNLSDFLVSKNIIKEGQRVNVAFSMGHRDDNHERNQLAHNRIAKEELIKII